MHDNQEIERLRPARNKVDPYIPYHYLHEPEPDGEGGLKQVNTIFLTSKECSFKCLMCDLWKNTLAGGSTPVGAVPTQIDYALERLPQADVIKLYNSGNFFDLKAVPPSDYAAIADKVKSYERVIVENHPLLCNEYCLEFKNLLTGRLEIAMGLETIHSLAMSKLNKQLTPDGFKRAADFLRKNDIDIRAFILLNPPYLTDKAESIKWTLETVKFAFDCGVQCCAIIPTRPGNGMVDLLYQQGNYQPPTLDMLEEVFDQALRMQRGRVFADTWDIGFLSGCLDCFDERKGRLEQINLDQNFNRPPIDCACRHHHE